MTTAHNLDAFTPMHSPELWCLGRIQKTPYRCEYTPGHQVTISSISHVFLEYRSCVVNSCIVRADQWEISQSGSTSWRATSELPTLSPLSLLVLSAFSLYTSLFLSSLHPRSIDFPSTLHRVSVCKCPRKPPLPRAQAPSATPPRSQATRECAHYLYRPVGTFLALEMHLSEVRCQTRAAWCCGVHHQSCHGGPARTRKLCAEHLFGLPFGSDRPWIMRKHDCSISSVPAI